MKISAERTSHFSNDGGTVGEAIIASRSCDRGNELLGEVSFNGGTITKSDLDFLI